MTEHLRWRPEDTTEPTGAVRYTDEEILGKTSERSSQIQLMGGTRQPVEKGVRPSRGQPILQEKEARQRVRPLFQRAAGRESREEVTNNHYDFGF
jgi:hypothetical protein